MTEIIEPLHRPLRGLPRTPQGLGTPAPQASAGRRRVKRSHRPIVVAHAISEGGPLNVLVLLDRPGRARDALLTVMDRIGPQLGRVVLCVPMRPRVRWGKVVEAVAELQMLTPKASFGARVVFGRRVEAVGLEACEGRSRLVVDLSEDAELRRTLRRCAIAYAVGPQGVARFADETNRKWREEQLVRSGKRKQCCS